MSEAREEALKEIRSRLMVFDRTLIEEKEYWVRRLSGEQGISNLRLDYRRPSKRSGAKAAVEIIPPGELYLKLTALVSGSPVLLYAALMAALKICLFKYNSSSPVVVGSPTRKRSGVSAQTPNVLAIANEIRNEMSIREVLLDVRERLSEAYARQSYPFSRLIKDLNLAQVDNRCPLFDIVLSWKSIHSDIPELKNDITITFDDDAGRLSGVVEFNRDLFHPESIKIFADHYLNVLTGIATNPDVTIGETRMMSQAERHRLQIELNDTKTNYPLSRCVHALFEEQSEITPEAIAVEFEGGQITYAELNRRANQVAHYLLDLHVEPGSPVGICLERSLEMVVGMLGILKAGGAYVPLDASYPDERLAFMLNESQAQVLLTQRKLIDDLPEHKARVISLDTDWRIIRKRSDKNPGVETMSESLAYVMYTSGSTGRPKGVSVPHRAVIRLVKETNYVDLGPGEIILQLAPISFDASTFEIWGCLLNGGRLAVMSPDMPSLTDLSVALKDHAVTTLWLTAGLFHLMVDDQFEGLKGLRQLLAGGDILSVSHVNKVLRESGIDQIINGYGPTENTTFTCCHRINSPDQAALSVAIGRPISNTQVYILDNDLRLVPWGAEGQLYTGGDGLARGYLHRPDLTAEKFVPDPLSLKPGARLYGTGDIARYRYDSNIEYLGRVDTQVKIRGYRIELGEIETALMKQDDVREAVVVARDGDLGEKRLVAYVVMKEGKEMNGVEIRRHLREQLPDYMAPWKYIGVDQMPLTSNGKVDRARLAGEENTWQEQEQEHKYEAARTAVEEVLVGIWRQVLGADRVGIHDNFFELGGDSIISIQAVSRANQAGLRLTPRQLFEHQTIAELARVAGVGAAPEVEQARATGQVPLTPIQQWFFEQNLARPHHFNQSIMLQVSGDVQPVHIEKAVQALILHHDALRLRFIKGDDGVEQSYGEAHEGEPIWCTDLSGLSETEKVSVISARSGEAQASLNLEEGPLMRVVLFNKRSDNASLLLIVIHHLVVDGVSWRILFEDFLSAYQQAKSGEAVTLPAKTISFKRWAELLTEYVGSGGFDHELAYWLSASKATTSRVPLDYPDGVNTTGSARQVTRSLSEEQTRTLLQKTTAIYRATVNDLLLTALTVAYAKLTGEQAIVVDVEAHGREPLFEGEDLSRTFGWFTAYAPVALSVAEAPEAWRTLKLVKEQLRRMPNRGIGYGALRYLGRTRPGVERLRSQPGAEIIFNYLGQFNQTYEEKSEFTLSHEYRGATEWEGELRTHPLAITAGVLGSRLELNWYYSENLHHLERVERFADLYEEALNELIAHTQTGEWIGYVPSDFPLANLKQSELDRIAGIDDQVEDIYPLSPSQQLWLSYGLYSPESEVGFEQLSWGLKGHLDFHSFELACQQIVDRHAVLRTGFVWEGVEKPLQVVRRGVKIKVKREDWRALPKPEQARGLEQYLEQERRAKYDFTEPPLMRLAVIEMGEDGFEVVWGIHHVIIDGWCAAQVMTEALQLYEAHRKSERKELENIRPYRDYIEWLCGQDEQKAESYWRRRLKGIKEPTRLTDGGRARTLAERGYDEKHLNLDEETTRRLDRLARAWKLTMSTVMQASWAVVLSRHCMERNVMFGATVSGRPAGLAGVDTMVGLFANMLPVSIEVKEEERIEEWLKQLQHEHVEQQEHEYSSLTQLHNWSEVGRNERLFESLLIYQNYPVEKVAADTLSVDIEEIRGGIKTNFPVTLVASSGAKLHVSLIYERQKYDSVWMERVLRQLAEVLKGISLNNHRRVRDLSVISIQEEALIKSWSMGQPVEERKRLYIENDSGQEKTLLAKIEERSRTRPRALAARTGLERVTYGGLDRKANQMGHYLRSLGVKAEDVVAILMPPGCEVIVCMLGAWKAAAAYVLLDSTWTAEELARVLEQSGAQVVLTTEKIAGQVDLAGVTAVFVDSEKGKISQHSKKKPECAITRTTAALVAPFIDGALITLEHANLLICSAVMREELGLQPAERLAIVRREGEDWTGLEALLGLSLGACVSIERFEDERGAAKVIQRLRESNAAVVFANPATIRELVRKGWEQKKPQKIVSCGAELSWDLEKQLKKPGTRLWSIEGWREAGGWNLLREVVEIEESLPALRALAGTETHILDDQLRVVGEGMLGELYIGGEVLARRSEQDVNTGATRYTSNLCGDAGERLYKTGERVRNEGQGYLTRLGSTMREVMVNGKRLSLARLEREVKRLEGVWEVAAVSREREGEAEIVIYVEGKDENLNKAGLRKQVREIIGTRAVRVMIEHLPRLPVGRDGCVDLRALPDPQARHARPPEDYMKPRTIVEYQLVDIWEELFNVHPIGVTDNFFEMGGHSILAVGMIARIQREFGQDLSLHAFLQAATIEQMARVIQQQIGLPTSPLVPIQTRGSRHPLFLVHPGGGAVMCYRPLSRRLGEDQPVYGFQALDIPEHNAQIEIMAAAYIRAMRSVQQEGPYSIAGWSFGSVVAFEMAQQLKRDGQDVAFLGLLDLVAPIPRFQTHGTLPDDQDPIWLQTVAELWDPDQRVSLSLEELGQIAPSGRLPYLLERAKRAGILPAEVEVTDIARYVQGYIDRTKAKLKYKAEVYPGRITLFRTSQTPDEELGMRDIDPTLGWGELSTYPIDVCDIAGTHRDMMNEPYVQSVAKHLTAYIGKTEAASLATKA